VLAGGGAVGATDVGATAAGAVGAAPVRPPLLPTVVALPGATSTSTIWRTSPELGSITTDRSRPVARFTAEIFLRPSIVRSTLSTSYPSDSQSFNHGGYRIGMNLRPEQRRRREQKAEPRNPSASHR
jgi:hypothetical protein